MIKIDEITEIEIKDGILTISQFDNNQVILNQDNLKNILKAINYTRFSTELPTKEIIDYLERSEDFYIDDFEMANRFYNAALDDVKYFINKQLEEQNKAIT